MAKTRKLALMALFVAIALTIFMIESQLPPIAPIPGVKLGLANVVTLTVKRFAENQLWIVSALAGMAHNAGQLLACVLVVQTPGVFAYAPILAASGVITGCFTGFAAMYLMRALRKSGTS